ncbi:hypothetical protein MSIMFB_05287 [Mycobacterium simulans]|uniref:Uncharacterized protein n=1 Tax=Mycobacterium simulans TaxID=627089 RepID=A0A7Z7NDB2_9MYCO|nr:hypothetical protein MSIMFB_05287 [Mycobacterium simulans]
MTKLHQDFESFATGASKYIGGGERGRCGCRAVTKSVQDAEQGSSAVDIDRDRLVATDEFARSWPTLRRPLDRPEPPSLMHAKEPISTFR